MPNYVLLGAAGYVAPRHMKAIKDTGGDLIAAFDPADSVGVIDSYFPDAAFFTEFERFDRHCSKRYADIDYVVICSPNYLHDSHCSWGLRLGADVICEKPLCLTMTNLNRLRVEEGATGGKINVILQLRYAMANVVPNTVVKNMIKVKYYTPRGKWYHYSWKGNPEKSGGLATNIGIHLFDFLIWRFGTVVRDELYAYTNLNVKGKLVLTNATVEYDLSINPYNEPLRSFKINGEEWKPFLFTDLHTKCYEEILKGNGFGIDDIAPATTLTERLRNKRGRS